MLDVRVREYIDLKGILEFYKSELESENKSYISEAIRRYGIVSKVVGKENSEFYLLPLILKTIEAGNYEINHIISEELSNIIDVNYHYCEESKQTIREISSYLLFNDEINIRMETIRSLELIFSLFNSDKLKAFIDEILLPILKIKFHYSENEYSSTNSSLTDKLSLCNIVPTLILPHCTKVEQNNLLLLYLSLCDDEVPSLRISACQNLVIILKKIFPLKYGMSLVDYQDSKLHNQDLITEKLLNLIFSLYKDQTSCNILRSSSVGIAIQLYVNPIFYLEYISSDDRNNLLNFACSYLKSRLYSQRQAVIEELIPIYLSAQGYYDLELNEENKYFFEESSNKTESILTNLTTNYVKTDIIQCIFDILKKENDVEIKVLVFNFFETLFSMGINFYEKDRKLNSGKYTEVQRGQTVNKSVMSVITFIYENISDLLLENHISFKCGFCSLLVKMVRYLQYLILERSSSINSTDNYENLEKLDFNFVKNNLIQIFTSYFKDSNINVIVTAINYLYKIIDQIDEENLTEFILPQIKSLVFNDTEIVTFNNNYFEKTITLQKWRVKRCIIRQIPLWVKYNALQNGVNPFFNSIIVRCILDPTLAVNICVLQTIMRIISEFKNFQECVNWIDEFIIPSILVPYIESKTNTIEFTYSLSNPSNSFSKYTEKRKSDEFKEKYDYRIKSNDHTTRVFIKNLIFVLYRSLFYKWAYLNFSYFKNSLDIQETKNSELFYEAVDKVKNRSKVLSEILDKEEIFTRFSKLIIPVILNSIEDPIINVSIATSQLVLQIIKLFSLDSYHSWEQKEFENSSFGEKSDFTSNCDDELLREHLLNQFEYDSIWHFRSIMSNYEIASGRTHIFPNCIYKEFVSVFEKYDDLNVKESEAELFHSVISIKSWYSSFSNKTF